MFWYKLITNLLGILIYPYGRLRAAGGSVGWRDRLALWSGRAKVDIWIHASSVGEVKVAQTLVQSLFKLSPGLRLHLSVMTSNGYQTANRELNSERNLSLSYLPLDVPFLTNRAMKLVSPKLLVITETEIWPGLINSASQAGCDVILVNGRMTEGSLRNYLKVPKLLSQITAQYQHCFFKTEADRQRFGKLGLPEDRGEVAGDMKFDSAIRPASTNQVATIRKRLGLATDDFLLVAGSTRPGANGGRSEDDLLVEIYAKLKSKYQKFRLVLAPRRLERAESVVETITGAGLTAKLVAGPDQTCAGDPDSILVINYMGGLIELYQAADLAFVGGTLVPVGGHNLLEPVWAGTPVLFGSSLDNVTEAAEYIIRANLGGQVNSADELQTRVAAILDGSVKYRRRTEDDPGFSATLRAAEYIVERLRRFEHA